MLRVVNFSSLDNEALKKVGLNNNSGTELDNFDFFSAIVNKPWGHEYLTYGNPQISIWILKINASAATSMHAHPQKQTVLLVLKGKARFSTLTECYELNEGEAVVIKKGVFHSTQALSDGVILMEAESPTRKTDLVRLNDNYGRQSKGYELQNEMCFDLSKFERIYLGKGDIQIMKKAGNMNLNVVDFNDKFNVNGFLKSSLGSIGIILNGEINSLDNSFKYTVGDAFLVNNEFIEKFNFENTIKLLVINKDTFDHD